MTVKTSKEDLVKKNKKIYISFEIFKYTISINNKTSHLKLQIIQVQK